MTPEAKARITIAGLLVRCTCPKCVLSKCHDIRNLAEYEGDLNVDERLVTDLIAACNTVADRGAALLAIQPT